MSSLPSNLLYMASRLSGFTTNIFRLETDNQTTASANSIISVSLPSNSIINLKSFKMFFTANSSVTAAKGARLPTAKDLIERVEVSLGGVVLSQGTNFVNVLSAAKRALSETYCDSVLGHPEYIRTISYMTGAAALANTANENETCEYCCDEWEGFMGTAQPQMFDTSIVPMIKVRIYMASNNVITTGTTVVLGDAAGNFADTSVASTTSNPGTPATATTGADYLVSNIYFTIECLSLADMAYENLLASQMASAGFLEVPYKAYYTFQDTHTGASKFSVASASLDRLYLAWRGSNYNAQSTPVTVSGYKENGAFVSVTAGAATTIDVGKPQFDIGGVLGTNSEKYLARYFNFSQPALFASNPTWKAQIQLNGAMMPQFQASPAALYGITRNSLEYARKGKQLAFRQYLDNYCVQCFRFNLQDSEFSRRLSGIDTRSSNLNAVVNTTGALVAANPNLMMFAETTEILRIGYGRSVNIVV